MREAKKPKWPPTNNTLRGTLRTARSPFHESLAAFSPSRDHCIRSIVSSGCREVTVTVVQPRGYVTQRQNGVPRTRRQLAFSSELEHGKGCTGHLAAHYQYVWMVQRPRVGHHCTLTGSQPLPRAPTTQHHNGFYTRPRLRFRPHSDPW